ncbi:serine/threonine-protein kinase Pink1, mitochondrial-like [Penaeus japonicus]|nr:serine/threonine-protein kinase Pink1, mitochondrial-like [Penaeus japonicus]
MARGAVAKTSTEHLNRDSNSEERVSLEKYPLAIKMMFNYEAESNAPAILRAMYKEMLPARSLQLDEAQLEWQERFCSKQLRLPTHHNIVDMPCVFVDRIPFLEDSMQLYPDALPMRLNPRGSGRNMSLFCVMKRYDLSLREYIKQYEIPRRTSLLLLTQLLEAVLHINKHNVSHRDLKSDNILLSLAEGWQYPHLVLTDFGCSVVTEDASMTVPFPSREVDPRQGNSALMAPEVKTAVPGFLRPVNYSHADLWAVGTLSYEMYGLENPFCHIHPSTGSKQQPLDSFNYKESQLPRLPKSVPPAVRHLIHDLLRRNPRNRPSANVAATLCQLILWAPSKWLSRHSLTLPSQTEIMQWLLCLTTKVLCEARLSGSHHRKQYTSREQQKRMEEMGVVTSDRQGGQLEYELVSTFLERVHYMDIVQAIKWNRAF